MFIQITHNEFVISINITSGHYNNFQVLPLFLRNGPPVHYGKIMTAESGSQNFSQSHSAISPEVMQDI